MNIKGSEVFLWVLIGLAIVASIIMMFSSSDAWQKIAVLAALWAAALGAFLVMKMRGESQADADRLEELETQLDHERARAEEERARSEQAIARSEESDETLAAIREQLDAMRAQLEELTGRTYEYEPNSITASATRLREIGSTSFIPPEPPASEPPASEPPREEPEDAEVVTADPDQGGSHTAEHAAEEPKSEPTWSWTPPSSSYVEPSESADTYHGRRRKEDDSFDFLQEPAVEEESYHGRRRKEDEPPRFGGWTPVTDPVAADDEWRAPDIEDIVTAKPDQTAQIPLVPEAQERLSGHGRRRADDREGGVSVADLLKNLKK